MSPSGPASLVASASRSTSRAIGAPSIVSSRSTVTPGDDGIDDVDPVARRHHDPLGQQPGGHADLLAGELPSGRRRRRRGRVAHRLGERSGHDAGAVGHSHEGVGGAEFHQRGRGEPHHRERGDRRGGAPDLLEHDARLDEAEAGAAHRLGQRDADDAGLRQRATTGRGRSRRRRRAPASRVRAWWRRPGSWPRARGGPAGRR